MNESNERNAIRAAVVRADFAIDFGQAVVFVRELAGRIEAAGFAGRAMKPAWRYSFRSLRDAGVYAERWVAGVERKNAATAQRRAERTAYRHTLQVGDVLYTNWGYEQTNVDFYQVTARIGSTMVEVRKIAQESEQGENMSGLCTPVPGEFVGAAFSAKVGLGNRIKIRHSLASPAPYTELAGARIYRPHRWSAYA